MSTAEKRQVIEAVYEHGTFRVLEAGDLDIPEGQKVRIIVEPSETRDVLDLMLHFYDGTPEEEVKEIEKIALDRRDFFGGRSNN